MSIYTDKLLNSNLIGAKTTDELFLMERKLSQTKVLYLKQNPIKGDFDYKHLKDIHKFIFEYIYSTAGKDRAELGFKNTPFGKYDNDGIFNTFVDGSNIRAEAKKIFDELREKNFLKNMDFGDFNKQAANFFIKLNNLHPFIEGNGRTQRIFMRELAKEAGYNLALNKIKGADIINACSYARYGNKTDLSVLFITVCKPIDKNTIL
ncbi:MAG: Fic family protein [Campylobacteraceae bacterium]|nr:Fic family protein [Campylobacteraceae bacterium]